MFSSTSRHLVSRGIVAYQRRAALKQSVSWVVPQLQARCYTTGNTNGGNGGSAANGGTGGNATNGGTGGNATNSGHAANGGKAANGGNDGNAANNGKHEKQPAEETPEQQSITKLKKELEDAKQDTLLAVADRQNSIRIAKDDVRKAKEYGIQKFATALLDVNDILERALESVKPDKLANNPDLKNFYEGVQMMERLMLKVYEQSDIKRSIPLGQKFDPNIHQALQEVVDPSKETGTVCYVMKAGYQLKDRLLRPASVMVVKADPAAKASPAAKPETKPEAQKEEKEEPVASS